MAIIVDIPSRGTSAEFPDDATQEEIKSALDYFLSHVFFANSQFSDNYPELVHFANYNSTA